MGLVLYGWVRIHRMWVVVGIDAGQGVRGRDRNVALVGLHGRHPVRRRCAGHLWDAVKWICEKARDGEIVATLFDRSYMVKVTIAYDTEKYQITYKDSANLKYNGSTIHRSYERWVGALKMNIDKTFTIKRAAANQ
jgi:hypothetical protein